MPYIIEYYHKTGYKELPYTVNSSKSVLQKEVDEMNKSLDKETTRFLPVKDKYRVKKIRNSDVKKKANEPMPVDPASSGS